MSTRIHAAGVPALTLLTLGLALGMALAPGCAGGGPKWVKPGASDEQLQRDQNDCMSNATVYGDPGAFDANTRARVERDFEDCMYARGWKRAEPERRR